jgi:predicted HTH transcriptional regulator
MKLENGERKRFVKKLFPYKDPDRVMYIREFVEKAEILIKQLKDDVTVSAIQKLWSPGLMTCKDLMDMTGETKLTIERKINELVELGIIKQATRGIYIRGEYSSFLMNVFAHIVVQLIPEDGLEQ